MIPDSISCADISISPKTTQRRVPNSRTMGHCFLKESLGILYSCLHCDDSVFTSTECLRAQSQSEEHGLTFLNSTFLGKVNILPSASCICLSSAAHLRCCASLSLPVPDIVFKGCHQKIGILCPEAHRSRNAWEWL